MSFEKKVRIFVSLIMVLFVLPLFVGARCNDKGKCFIAPAGGIKEINPSKYEGKVIPSYYLTPTGIQIKIGTQIMIVADGKICYENTENPERCTGPDGIKDVAWGLYGVVGVDGVPFKVGKNFNGPANGNGELYLMIPEYKGLKFQGCEWYTDNTGSFDVTIEIGK